MQKEYLASFCSQNKSVLYIYVCVCVRARMLISKESVKFSVGSFGLIQYRVKTLRNPQCSKALEKLAKKILVRKLEERFVKGKLNKLKRGGE